MIMNTPLINLFGGLSLGYFVCVVAKKQQNLLKTVGYTVGISMMVLSLAWGLVSTVCMTDMHKCMKMMGGGKMMCGQKEMKCSMMK